MLTLALRNVLRHKVRMAVTLASVTCGVIALILSGGFIRDVYAQLAEALIHSQLGHIQVARKAYFDEGSRSPDKYRIDDAGPMIQAMAKTPGVVAVLPRVHFSGLLNNGHSDWPIVGEGVDPDKENKLGSLIRIIEGRSLRSGDEFGIVVGQGVAKALSIGAGDHVTLLMSTRGGALDSLDLTVMGVFQSFSKDFDDRAVRVNLDALGRTLGEGAINIAVAELEHTDQTRQVQAAFRQVLDTERYDIRRWDELTDFYDKTVALYENQFGFLKIIILTMVVLSVSNSVNTSVFERVSEFGTMQAMGSRRRFIWALILTESSIVGLAGALVGALLGVVLAQLISAAGIPMPPPPNANLGYTAHVKLDFLLVLSAAGIGLIACILAAILPALRVSRTPVVDALRQGV